MSPDQHVFTLFDRHFLLDVPTGALISLDERALRALTDTGDADPEVAAEIAALRAGGLLQPDPVCEAPVDPASGWLKALCLHVSHDCNLRCTYCFAGKGPFGGERENMPPETGRRAIDLLLARSGPIAALEVDFFGGEPLLAMETVREVVRYGRQKAAEIGKTIHFTLTTNAVLLSEETLSWLNENRVSLVLSLDGRPEVHDRCRPDSGGLGSYARVAGKIVRAAASRGGQDYYVRGTFTRSNLDFTRDVRHLLDLGLDRLSLEPVVALPAEEYALREEDLALVEAEYERLAGLYLERARAGRPFTFFHFEVDLEHGPCLGRRLSGCGAGHRYLAVTPGGRVYPCHQLVGRTQFLLGDVGQGLLREDLMTEFARADLFHKQGCRECWARYFCSGGCHANADLVNGDILQPDPAGCRLLRKRTECALAIRAMLAESV